MQRRCLAAFVLSLGLSLAGTADLSHASPPDHRVDALSIRQGPLCMDIREAQMQAPGAGVEARACDGRLSQSWRREGDRLVSLATGQCLEVHPAPPGSDGTRVRLTTCRAGDVQRWHHGRGELRNLADGRCLDVAQADQGMDPARMQAWRCHGRPNQQWRLDALPGSPPHPNPVQTRDVEAGPIWHQLDAQGKCPTVCVPGRWTGHWRTTVQGRMSVCQCQAAAMPVPEGPGSLAPPTVRPMSEAEFAALLGALRTEGFSSSQMNLLESVARDHHFLVSQLRQVIDTVSFSSDRMRATEILAPRVVDPQNAYLLGSAFDFESEREKVREIFRRARDLK